MNDGQALRQVDPRLPEPHFPVFNKTAHTFVGRFGARQPQKADCTSAAEVVMTMLGVNLQQLASEGTLTTARHAVGRLIAGSRAVFFKLFCAISTYIRSTESQSHTSSHAHTFVYYVWTGKAWDKGNIFLPGAFVSYMIPV